MSDTESRKPWLRIHDELGPVGYFTRPFGTRDERFRFEYVPDKNLPAFLAEDNFIREPKMAAWRYTGPLEPAITYVEEQALEHEVHSDKKYIYISTRSNKYNCTTTADDLESGWRSHIPIMALPHGTPHPDEAIPGETLTDHRIALVQLLLDSSDQDYTYGLPFMASLIERRFFGRWQQRVRTGNNGRSFKDWITYITDNLFDKQPQ